MKKSSIAIYCLTLMVVCMAGGGLADQSLAEECSAKLPEVMTCIAFASGKESTPQQKCCDSVKGMKESNPACLCFLIQQIHNGTNPTLQKMNIQEGRLLRLPAECKIANASIADCPRLLKLPPNSPDAAIFTNVTNTPPSTPAAAGSATESHAFKHEAAAAKTMILLGTIFVLLSLVF